MTRRTLTIIALSVFACLAPRPADACSCVADFSEFHVPTGHDLPIDSGGLLWEVLDFYTWALEEEPGATPESILAAKRERLEARLELWRVSDAGPSLTSYTLELFDEDPDQWLVIPAGGFAEGDRFRARAWQDSSQARDHQTEQRGQFELVEVHPRFYTEVDFEVGPPVDPKPGPWTLRVGEPQMHRVVTNQGPGCSTVIRAKTVAVELLPPAGMSASEAAAYGFETYVDGQRWRPRSTTCETLRTGRNWTGAVGSDLIYAACHPDDEQDPQIRRIGTASYDLTLGRHEVEIRGKLPIQGHEFRTEPVAFVLDCEGEVAADAEILPIRPRSDPKPPPQPKPEPAAPPVVAASEPPPVAHASAHPGCALGAERSPSSALWLFVLLGLGARRRLQGTRAGPQS